MNGASSEEQELHISKVTDFYEKWKDRQELVTNEQEERGEEHNNQEEGATNGANGTEETRGIYPSPPFLLHQEGPLKFWFNVTR